MPYPRNIVLTGFMGTGKSTVGRLLAERLGWEAVDTDACIVERAGCSIATLFREHGEAAFRDMEAAVARELAERERLVIATGGRLMLDPENAERLGREARVFCLTAEPEEILRRVSLGGAPRPLLDVADPQGRITELLAERRDRYDQFEQVSTEERTPEQVAQELEQRLQTRLSKSEIAP